jgi:F0F1-type ATP synthase delta subunit
VEEQIGKKAVLEILVKEEIVGGAVVEYSGEYRDYSLARKLDELLETGVVKNG